MRMQMSQCRNELIDPMRIKRFNRGWQGVEFNFRSGVCLDNSALGIGNACSCCAMIQNCLFRARYDGMHSIR